MRNDSCFCYRRKIEATGTQTVRNLLVGIIHEWVVPYYAKAAKYYAQNYVAPCELLWRKIPLWNTLYIFCFHARFFLFTVITEAE